MRINSDINVLGSLPDWNLIKVFLSEDMDSIQEKGGIQSYTSIKTDKSVRRFENAIKNTLIESEIPDLKRIVNKAIKKDVTSLDTLLLLFWNASNNNDLFFYINENIYFPAFYTGRVSIRNDEVGACIKDLRQREDDLKKWSEITIKTTASKYLTLIRKFGLMEGSRNKTIVYPYLSDAMFTLYIYWIKAVSNRPNLLDSKWLNYSFCEKQVFIDRVLQKRFSKFFNVIYTGDRLNIETLIPYGDIYDNCYES